MDHSVRPPTMTIDLGIFLALACAFVANLGFFYKYRGANSVARVDVRHPLRSGRALFSSKWFAIGMIVATASWALHVAALALAPMSVVQVALAAGVVLIAVMADRMFGFKVGPRQWVGLWLTAAGLVRLDRYTGSDGAEAGPGRVEECHGRPRREAADPSAATPEGQAETGHGHHRHRGDQDDGGGGGAGRQGDGRVALLGSGEAGTGGGRQSRRQ